jgi:SAM-dependent methyltransferase
MPDPPGRSERTAPSGPVRALRPAPFGASEVERHYAELARVYGSRANAACRRAYADLVRQTFADSRRVLELGAGSSNLLAELSAPLRVACDLSLPMLTARMEPVAWERVVCDAQALPFRDRAFDAIFAVNLLEHVPEPQHVVSEVARLLSPGGRFLAVTPNGNLAGLLGLLEWLRLKLPEGPHRFLGTREVAALGGRSLRTLKHQRFLALPLGSPGFVRWLDGCAAEKLGRGLFQYIVLEKCDASP